jgi:hypothetical protein
MIGASMNSRTATTTALGRRDRGFVVAHRSSGTEGHERDGTSGRAAALSPLDRIQIQQLVRKYAWALDSGDNYGYAYADLFTPDGIFVGTNQGPADARTRGETSWRHWPAAERAAQPSKAISR